jgi:hypothetical protein
MNVFLWIVQAVLAAASGMAGLMKLTQPNLRTRAARLSQRPGPRWYGPRLAIELSSNPAKEPADVA